MEKEIQISIMKLDIKVITEQIGDFFNDPEVSKFIYDTSIVATGLILILLLGQDGFPFVRSMISLGIWLLLIIALQAPKPAKLKSQPFEGRMVEDLYEEELHSWKESQ